MQNYPCYPFNGAIAGILSSVYLLPYATNPKELNVMVYNLDRL